MADSSDSTEMSGVNMGDPPCSFEQLLKPFIRFIISAGLHLNYGTSPGFMGFMEAVNPDSRKFDLETVVKEAWKEFANLIKELHSTFASLSHRVALACDVWRNENGLDYIRVTVHWIDSDWMMQRRIINFKEIEFPSRAASISDPVIESVNAWGIRDKIFSVTVDNACDYDDMEGLKNVVHPILDGKVFRVRCACHALNSCIKDGLDFVSEHVGKIRSGVELQVNYPERFVKLCAKYGLKPKYIMLDDQSRWDDTRKMLKSCMAYKDAFVDFAASDWDDDESVEISEQDWEVASVLCRFLDVFYEAVDNASRNYYPSSSGLLLHLVNIAKLFCEYKESGFEGKLSAMEEKFVKYYERIPDLYCLAAVMDPRIKLSGCECLLESFYQCTDNTKVNVEAEMIKLSDLLHEMFDLYASQSIFKTQQPSSCKPSASSTTSAFAWSLISQEKGKTADSAIDELTMYLQAPDQYSEHEMKDFDILTWWKSHEVIYPVLSTMARDLLTAPLSTLAPDCAFLIKEEKEIMDKSYHYSGRILEMYTCLKDWFNAEWRKQGVREPDDNDDGNIFGFENLAITNSEDFVAPTH